MAKGTRALTFTALREEKKIASPLRKAVGGVYVPSVYRYLKLSPDTFSRAEMKSIIS